MAHERKSDAVLSTRAFRSPIPPAKRDDPEDVAWGLQTAEAMWVRGEHADALKWIRRAAEAASEAEADDRALELAKAAADVATLLASRPAAAPAPALPAPAFVPAPIITTTSQGPPPLPVGGATRAPAAPPAAPKVATAAAVIPRIAQKAPTPPRMAVPPSRRGGRRSSPSYVDDLEMTKPHATAKGRASATSEARRARRNSRPSPEETSQHAPITTRQPGVDEIDAWPTASLLDDDDETQHTRIGEPAYTETAKTASARPPALLAPAPLVTTQAVRVVVWRGPDGVHVAPAGSQVAAIAVEAVLVAVDPGTDLAAWLSNK